MACLHILTGPDAGECFELTASETTIGRGFGNTIQLLDPMVSRAHCTIHREDGGYVLCEAGPPSATRVNGQVMCQRAIRFGDVVSMGSTTMMLMEERLRRTPAPFRRPYVREQ